MNITGIIAEYNPLHNGHIYHINKAKELTNPDCVVAVISGNYNQRGDISIHSKFEKTKAALANGIDLIVELPYIYVSQNAYVFGKSAVSILAKLGINKLVFGSETNNLEELKKYAELEVDVTRLKQLMHDGTSFPKAYGLLAGSLFPNDMLAVTYLKALKDTDIEPVTIQRTNEYLSTQMNIVSSATAIRKAIQNNEDYHIATPLTIDKPLFNTDLYPFIRNILFTSKPEELKNIFLVDEGIENLLIKNAVIYDKYEEFINACTSKRYTKSRLQRILLQIVMNITKNDVNALPECNYIRVLGFNSKGRQLIKQLDEDVKIVTQFKNIPEPFKQIEWKASLVYANLFEHPSEYIKRELKGPIIVE